VRALGAVIVACLSACGAPEEPACGGSITGIAAYDSLYEVGSSRPVIFSVSADERRAHASELLARARAAAEVDPARLAPAARIALQNDLWGLWRRLGADGDQDELRAALAAVIRRLALPPERIPGRGRIGVTTAAARTIDARWHLSGTELPVLSHERAFELRRVFHLAFGPDARALTSQLVALDDRGRAHASDVAGDLEILAPAAGVPSAARLFELDRHGLRCGTEALRETDRVSRVPGEGASSFFLELDPPAPVASMPCARCHDDGELDSLPDEEIPVEPRVRALLDQATELAAPIFR
jgi:hypothetical protein